MSITGSVRLVVAAVGVAILGFGCASSRPRVEIGYQRELGVVTEHDIRNALLPILTRHGFEIVRADGPPQIYVETQHRQRFPFSDEQEMGISNARNRILMRGRRVPQRTNMGDLYRVEIDIQNDVQIGMGEWTNAVRTPQFLEFARGLADELDHAVRSTTRVFDRRP